MQRSLEPPRAAGSLNAWEAYHRGLWHMYHGRGERAGRRVFPAGDPPGSDLLACLSGIVLVHILAIAAIASHSPGAPKKPATIRSAYASRTPPIEPKTSSTPFTSLPTSAPVIARRQP